MVFKTKDGNDGFRLCIPIMLLSVFTLRLRSTRFRFRLFSKVLPLLCQFNKNQAQKLLQTREFLEILTENIFVEKVMYLYNISKHVQL